MDPTDWERTLRSRGHRITHQRVLILQALAESHHPTAESLHESLAQTDPGVNLSTVYRNLAVLEEAGLVVHAHIGPGAPVYHLVGEPAHIHLSCLGCGRVASVDASLASRFAAEVAQATGFAVDASHSAIHGLCAECSDS